MSLSRAEHAALLAPYGVAIAETALDLARESETPVEGKLVGTLFTWAASLIHQDGPGEEDNRPVVMHNIEQLGAQARDALLPRLQDVHTAVLAAEAVAGFGRGGGGPPRFAEAIALAGRAFLDLEGGRS